MSENIETTIVEGSHGQLIVTVPKQIAKWEGVRDGNKVRWHKQNGRIIGEVIP